MISSGVFVFICRAWTPSFFNSLANNEYTNLCLAGNDFPSNTSLTISNLKWDSVLFFAPLIPAWWACLWESLSILKYNGLNSLVIFDIIDYSIGPGFSECDIWGGLDEEILRINSLSIIEWRRDWKGCNV